MHGNIIQLSLLELRKKWAEAWGVEPHTRIGRTMLEKSLTYKIRRNRNMVACRPISKNVWINWSNNINAIQTRLIIHPVL
jgi:hypothetical protein